MHDVTVKLQLYAHANPLHMASEWMQAWTGGQRELYMPSSFPDIDDEIDDEKCTVLCHCSILLPLGHEIDKNRPARKSRYGPLKAHIARVTVRSTMMGDRRRTVSSKAGTIETPNINARRYCSYTQLSRWCYYRFWTRTIPGDTSSHSVSGHRHGAR